MSLKNFTQVRWFCNLLLAFSIICYSTTASPCVSFAVVKGKRVVVAQSYEWVSGEGLIFINKHGVKKTAVLTGNHAPADWVSKFGSITFNQYGREMPSGGMNEASLVVTALAKFKIPGRETQFKTYEYSGESVNETQWVQYQLDNFSTVEEVIGNSSLGISKLLPKLNVHYWICDAGGECAVVEFIQGRMIVHHQNPMPFYAVNNCPYDCIESEVLGKYCDFGGDEEFDDPEKYGPKYEKRIQWTASANSFVDKAVRILPGPLPCLPYVPYVISGNSIWAGFNSALGPPNQITHRFAYILNRLADYADYYPESSSPVDYSFRLLSDVGPIPWHIVYDTWNRKIYFRTRSNTIIKSIDASAFDYSCASPVQVLNVNVRVPNASAGRNDVTTKFESFDAGENGELIKSAFGNLKSKARLGFPEDTVEVLSAYPGELTCTYAEEGS